MRKHLWIISTKKVYKLGKVFFVIIIIQCDPDVIMLGWCYSLNGDVSMMLRSEGVFSQMILNNDLRIITGNPLARLNDIQREIIKETGHIGKFVRSVKTDCKIINNKSPRKDRRPNLTKIPSRGPPVPQI